MLYWLDNNLLLVCCSQAQDIVFELVLLLCSISFFWDAGSAREYIIVNAVSSMSRLWLWPLWERHTRLSMGGPEMRMLLFDGAGSFQRGLIHWTFVVALK